MKAVSVFLRVFGARAELGEGGGASSDIKGMLLGCPRSTPRCPLSRPPLSPV
jgi:hypothetical protein